MDQVTRTRASNRRLPFELEDFILDFLHGSTEDLNVCALVCRHWLYSSRCRTSIRISIDEDWKFSDRTLNDFQNLIDHPNATLQHFTRHFAIESSEKRTQAGRIIAVLKRLQSLSSLSIIMKFWDSSWHDAAAEFSSFSTITGLTVDGTEADDFSDILHVACSLPSLRNLHLIGFFWTLDYPAGDHVTVPKNLETLVFEFCSPTPVSCYLTSLAVMPRIHALRFRCAYDEDINLTTRFLEAIGPCLTA